MRSRLISTLLLLATTSGLPGAAAQEAGKAALRLCWEDTAKLPYLVLEKNQAPRGISVDLVTAILKRAGLAAEAVVWPWKRCLAEIAAGSIDLVPNASYTDERTKFALFSKPLYRTHMAFFYDTRRFASPPVIEPHDNLKALRIGGVLGFNYRHLKDIPIDTGARSREVLLRKLEVGRIDLAIEQVEPMLAAIRELGIPPSRLAYVQDPFLPAKAFHILISKQHPQAEALLGRINAAIDAMEQDGTLAAINARATAPKRP